MLLHYDLYLEIKIPPTSMSVDEYNLLEKARSLLSQLVNYKEQVDSQEIIDILKIQNKIEAIIHESQFKPFSPPHIG